MCHSRYRSFRTQFYLTIYLELRSLSELNRRLSNVIAFAIEKPIPEPASALLRAGFVLHRVNGR